MARDFSVSSSSSSTSVERMPPANNSSSSDSKPALSNSSKPMISDVYTSKELKMAELLGSQVTMGDEQMIKTIERANKALLGRSTSFEFSIHEKTKQISIKVLDKDTGEIIREIPPEKTLDMVAKMWEMAGLLVDERR